MPAAYIASPYGFSPATKHFHDSALLPAVQAAGLTPLDPWADPDGAVARALAEADSLEALRRVNVHLARANVERIHACDAVLAILDGTDVDSGVAAEVGYAAALGKPVVGLRLDFRPAGDNAATLVNLQVEHFLTASARDLDTAIALLVTAAGGR